MARKKVEEMIQDGKVQSIMEDILLNRVIAIDCGKSNMKVIYEDNAYIYANKINKGFGDSLNDITWNVEYEGEKYYVGDGATGSDLNEGKGSLEHRVQALTAIASRLNPEEENNNIVLMYGESFDYYNSEEHKESVIKTFMGEHSITLNGEEFKFEIKKVHILPEGYGHIISNINEYLRGRCYVIDFGGRTMNFLAVNNGAPIQESSFSNEMGIYDLASKCLAPLKRAGFNRDAREVESYIRYGATPEIQNIINEVALGHFDSFDKDLRVRKIDIHSLLKTEKIIFVGGGSKAFAPVIKQYYGENAIIPNDIDPILANVVGFYRYGKRKFGKVVL